MNWIVHIGPQKTGSKAIQRFLAYEVDRIRSPRVIYPEEGREGVWHEPLFHALSHGDASPVEAAVKRYSGGPWDLGIWSCEAFHSLPRAGIERLRGMLVEARVILFLRRQDERANSHLNQLVKAHKVGIDTILQFEGSLTHYNPLYDYQAVILSWGEHFGLESITPLIYDKREDAVEAFCRAAGIVAEPRVRPSTDPNAGLDQTSYETLRRLKEEHAGSVDELPELVDRFRQELTARGMPVGEVADLIPTSTKRAIMDLYRESNEWVRATWFPDTKWPD